MATNDAWIVVNNEHSGPGFPSNLQEWETVDKTDSEDNHTFPVIVFFQYEGVQTGYIVVLLNEMYHRMTIVCWYKDGGSSYFFRLEVLRLMTFFLA